MSIRVGFRHRVIQNTDTERFTQLHVPKFRICTAYKNYKNGIVSFLNACRFVFSAEMKVQWEEGGGRLLLGDNRGLRAVVLRTVGYQSIENVG